MPYFPLVPTSADHTTWPRHSVPNLFFKKIILLFGFHVIPHTYVLSVQRLSSVPGTHAPSQTPSTAWKQTSFSSSKSLNGWLAQRYPYNVGKASDNGDQWGVVKTTICRNTIRDPQKPKIWHYIIIIVTGISTTPVQCLGLLGVATLSTHLTFCISPVRRTMSM